MANLALELARIGHDVTYVAEKMMSPQRLAMGWEIPDLGEGRLIVASEFREMSTLASRASSDSVHLIQGLRGNGAVSHVRVVLSQRRVNQWVIMETVDDAGVQGIGKRVVYTRLLRRFARIGGSVLAIGHTTPGWVRKRGFPAERTAPFAYFLPCGSIRHAEMSCARPFRFCFVGSFLVGKRVLDLVLALAALHLKSTDAELWLVGSGPEEPALRELAGRGLSIHVRWFGMVSQNQVPALLDQVDVLVLPSGYDGWGAVVSEALMAGVPAICSAESGAAGVVQTSGVGGTYQAGDIPALSALLKASLRQGVVPRPRRAALRDWAVSCLSGRAGASYFDAILRAQAAGEGIPAPPWSSGPSQE